MPTELSQSSAEVLRSARAQIDAGQAAEAMQLARQAEQAAASAGDVAAQAEAKLCIADIQLRLTGEFREALASARHAAAGFQKAHGTSGECRALALQAIASARLAYFETAVDSALLAVLLSRTSELGMKDEVVAYHALAIAMFAGRAYDEAANAMERAIERARQVCSPLELFELHADLASTEVIRYITSRETGELLHDLRALETQLLQCDALLAQGDFQAQPRYKHVLNAYQVSRAHLLIWQGRSAEAQAQIQDVQLSMQSPPRPWLESGLNWCRAELALSRSQLGEARMHCEGMVAVAMTYQHGTLLNLGLRLKAHLAGLAGDHATAAQALRTLSTREQKARAEGLRVRIADVERQMELRQRTEELRAANAERQRFHQLAHEDALTKLPNRRQFDNFMKELLERCQAQGGQHCLVYVDVDRFKEINDRHSHSVGDQVLQAVGQILRQSAREHDLPARLAGDEFALVVLDAGLEIGQGLCRRLKAAVHGHDWGTLVPGLAVSVSVGVAQIRSTDDLAALLTRADAAMYADKAARQLM